MAKQDGDHLKTGQKMSGSQTYPVFGRLLYMAIPVPGFLSIISLQRSGLN
jgi:hypothetical protein